MYYVNTQISFLTLPCRVVFPEFIRCTAIFLLLFCLGSESRVCWKQSIPSPSILASNHALPFDPPSRTLSCSSGSFTCTSPTRQHVSVCGTVWRVRPATVLGHFEQSLYRRQNVSVDPAMKISTFPYLIPVETVKIITRL